MLGEQYPAPSLGRCRVADFNGRSTDAVGGIWGALAEQLGKAEQFARYISPLLSAPGPEAWKQLLGGDPLVLFLDELPFYLEYAVAVPVGNADLGVVTTTALANLLSRSPRWRTFAWCCPTWLDRISVGAGGP